MIIVSDGMRPCILKSLLRAWPLHLTYFHSFFNSSLLLASLFLFSLQPPFHVILLFTAYSLSLEATVHSITEARSTSLNSPTFTSVPPDSLLPANPPIQLPTKHLQTETTIEVSNSCSKRISSPSFYTSPPPGTLCLHEWLHYSLTCLRQKAQ